MENKFEARLKGVAAAISVAMTLAACGGSDPAQEGLGIQSQQSASQQSEPQSSRLLSETVTSEAHSMEGLSDLAGLLSESSGLFVNSSGVAQTFSTKGFIDKTNPFFKEFGNGRSCASCHQQAEGWSVTPQGLRRRFEATAGTDPIFRLVDGANSPHAPDATLEQKRSAYSMLLNKGVIRIGMKIPATAEFELVNVNDPYGYASANELSLFRRPLPSANLKFLSAVMWDGRETARDASSSTCIRGTTICFASMDLNLQNQANTATKGHAEAAEGLTDEEKRSIVDFEMSLFSAQIYDRGAKFLTLGGAKGGPLELLRTDFYFGINDLQTGDYKTNAPFDPNVMRLYTAWADSGTQSTSLLPVDSTTLAARAAIARGEALFNTKPINMVGVKGINDAFNVPLFTGTCSSCHNAPNSGNRSVPLPIDIGVSDASRRTSDMPLYTLRHKVTGQTIETTDPGRALVTGKWQDIGRFKISALRGLASRAPYFHDGSARTLEDTVVFYNTRFGMGLTQREISDLAAFLKAL